MARLAVIAWLLTGGVTPATVADGLERLPAVLHLHSDLSTGDFSLEQLTTLADKQGIGALLLTENYLLRVEYGLAPFRALTRVVREEPSVLGLGIDRYLARVSEARAANPRVLIVPGVEVLPHYYWTGSPLALDMAVHDTQKNILVFGLPEQSLRALPVTGNKLGGFGWSSVLDALPGLLLVPGVYVLTLKRRVLRKVGRVLVVVKQRRWPAGLLLCGIAVLALVRGWPFAVDPYSPYRDLGLGPHQDLIDYVDRLGGVTVWSFPEAHDAGEKWVGPIRVAWNTPRTPTISCGRRATRPSAPCTRTRRGSIGPVDRGIGCSASSRRATAAGRRGPSASPASTASAPAKTWAPCAPCSWSRSDRSARCWRR
jgi:hypothetical protein